MIKVNNMSLNIEETSILKNMSFNILEKTLTILLGENGSGKSMLLKTLNGLHNKNYEGSILINNHELKTMKDRERASLITYTSPDFISTFDYSLYDIVTMGLYVSLGERNSITKKHEEKIREYMEIMDTWKIKDKSIQHVSTGERMRTFIARSFATESDIILLDEPTASLDIRHKSMLFGIIKKMVQNGKTFIISMHDLNDAINLETNVIVLSEGTVIESGMGADVINEDLIKKAYKVQSKKSNAFTFF